MSRPVLYRVILQAEPVIPRAQLTGSLPANTISPHKGDRRA